MNIVQIIIDSNQIKWPYVLWNIFPILPEVGPPTKDANPAHIVKNPNKADMHLMPPSRMDTDGVKHITEPGSMK